MSDQSVEQDDRDPDADQGGGAVDQGLTADLTTAGRRFGIVDPARFGVTPDTVDGDDTDQGGPSSEQRVNAAPGYDPAEYTVDEVHAYLADHPDEADAVIAAERAGKARKGITGDAD